MAAIAIYIIVNRAKMIGRMILPKKSLMNLECGLLILSAKVTLMGATFLIETLQIFSFS